MPGEIKRPFTDEELATLDKAEHALVRARPILKSHGQNKLCVSETIVLFWEISDKAKTPGELKN
jgi:hypothetical protein